jgi:hypothetical protein
MAHILVLQDDKPPLIMTLEEVKEEGYEIGDSRKREFYLLEGKRAIKMHSMFTDEGEFSLAVNRVEVNWETILVFENNS